MTDVIVLGGGMVGVSTALALQARGRSVLLIDKGEPGRETSYGNAGLIQAEAVAPYAVPLEPRRLLRILAGRSPEVALSLGAVSAWLPAALGYFRNSLPRRYAAIVPHYARLIVRATADHAPLIAAAGAEGLIRRDGFFQAFRSEPLLAAALAAAAKVSAEYGVAYQALDGAALATDEPHLRLRMAGAVHWTGTWSCRDPGGLVARYAALFTARGGAIEKAEARGLAPAGSGWRVDVGGRTLEAGAVVVALGPWSPLLLASLGYRVPMVLKRGYHQHFAASAPPARPFMDAENAAVISPMERGVRVLTGAELNTMEGSSNLRQITNAVAAARTLFALGEPVEATPWRGVRPCMPDMLPLIGKASRHKGLWLNFGHGHQGFTLGPTTAALLAEVMTGEAPAEGLKPYARV